MGYLLLFLKAIFHQGETVVVKKYGQRHQVGGMFFNAVVCLFSMVFFIVTDSGGFYFPKELWIYGIISCVMFAAGFYYMYMSLKTGSFGLTKLLTSFSGVITIAYGIVILKEPTNWLTYVSLVLVFASVFLMNVGNLGTSEDNDKKISLKWVIYVIITFVTNGFIGILQKEQQLRFNNQCNNEFMIISLAGAFLALMIFGIVQKRARLGYILKHGTLYGVCAGLFNGATNFVGILMLLYLPISISTPLFTGVTIVMSFALSVFLYKEKLSKLQAIGVLVGIAALILLNVSQFI